MKRGRLVVAFLLSGSAVIPAWAQQAPPPEPSCEEQLAVTAQYAALVKAIRDHYEREIAELRAKVQELTARIQKAKEPKPESEGKSQ